MGGPTGSPVWAFVCLCICVFVVFVHLLTVGGLVGGPTGSPFMCLCICCVCVCAFADCGWMGGPSGSPFGQAMDCKVLQGNVRRGLLPFLRPTSIFVNDCFHS